MAGKRHGNGSSSPSARPVFGLPKFERRGSQGEIPFFFMLWMTLSIPDWSNEHPFYVPGPVTGGSCQYL